MERKCGKYWKSLIFERKLQVCISYLRKMRIVCSITPLYSSTFYSLFLPFFVLEIFKFKCDKIFVRHLLPFPDSNDLNSCVIKLQISLLQKIKFDSTLIIQKYCLFLLKFDHFRYPAIFQCQKTETIKL